MNNDFGVTRDAICQWFSRVTRENHWQTHHEWPQNRYSRWCDPKIVIHGNSCIILYIMINWDKIRIWIYRTSCKQNWSNNSIKIGNDIGIHMKRTLNSGCYICMNRTQWQYRDAFWYRFHGFDSLPGLVHFCWLRLIPRKIASVLETCRLYVWSKRNAFCALLPFY